MKFDGIWATVISWAATLIVAQVMLGCSTGPLTIMNGGGQPNANPPTFTVAKTARVILWVGQSNDSGLSPRSDLAARYYLADPRIKSWDYTTRTAATYSLGRTGSDGNPENANDHAITKAIVPSYDNGVGPDPGFLYEWATDPQHKSTDELFVFKKDLTPPVSTDGSSIKAWLAGVGGHAPLYDGFSQEWQAFRDYLTAQGYAALDVTFICGIGEQDSSDYLNTGSSGANPDFAGSLTQFVNRFRTDGVLQPTSQLLIAQKQRPGNVDAVVAAGQAKFVRDNAPYAKLVVLPNPAFLDRDKTHYVTTAIAALGQREYLIWSGKLTGDVASAGGSSGADPGARRVYDPAPAVDSYENNSLTKDDGNRARLTIASERQPSDLFCAIASRCSP